MFNINLLVTHTNLLIIDIIFLITYTNFSFSYVSKLFLGKKFHFEQSRAGGLDVGGIWLSIAEFLSIFLCRKPKETYFCKNEINTKIHRYEDN